MVFVKIDVLINLNKKCKITWYNNQSLITGVGPDILMCMSVVLSAPSLLPEELLALKRSQTAQDSLT